MSENLPVIIGYHYSAAYREVIRNVIKATGFRDLVFDEPKDAGRQLRNRPAALIAPYERYRRDITSGGIFVDRPSESLVNIAGSWKVPWALLGRTTIDNVTALTYGPPKSMIISQGEIAARSDAERLAHIEVPNEVTKRCVYNALAGWLLACQFSQGS